MSRLDALAWSFVGAKAVAVRQSESVKPAAKSQDARARPLICKRLSAFGCAAAVVAILVLGATADTGQAAGAHQHHSAPPIHRTRRAPGHHRHKPRTKRLLGSHRRRKHPGSPTNPAGSAVAGSAAFFSFFSPTSVWNAPVADNAPLDPGSAAIVSGLGAEVAREEGLGIGPWVSPGAEIYVVGPHQPTVLRAPRRSHPFVAGGVASRIYRRTHPTRRTAGERFGCGDDGLAALQRQTVGVLPYAALVGRLARRLGWCDQARLAEPWVLRRHRMAGGLHELGRDCEQPARGRRCHHARGHQGRRDQSRARGQPAIPVPGHLLMACAAHGRDGNRSELHPRGRAPANRPQPQHRRRSTSRR